MLHVVLFRPEIPQNTGNIGRMCALTGSRLHLIHPLGFSTSDRYLRRSGLDYWQELDVHEHQTWESFRASELAPKRMWLMTTKATAAHWDSTFADGDGFVFGQESAGSPEWLHQELLQTRITIPQTNPKLRSLNLSTAAGIVVYEAMRQTRPQR